MLELPCIIQELLKCYIQDALLVDYLHVRGSPGGKIVDMWHNGGRLLRPIASVER